MRRTSFATMNCSVAQTLEVVGEWWSMLIVRDAHLGVTRFDDFQARLGISRNILSTRLDRLVRQGVLAREPYQEHPPRYDYRLTDKGSDLWLLLSAMRQWGDRWAAPDGAPVVVEHRGCGHATTVVAICAHCGEPLGPGALHWSPGPGARPGDSAIPELRRPTADADQVARSTQA